MPKCTPTVVWSSFDERGRGDRRAGLGDLERARHVLADQEDRRTELKADVDLVGDRHHPRARQVDRRLPVLGVGQRRRDRSRAIEEVRIGNLGVDDEVGLLPTNVMPTPAARFFHTL